MTLCRQLEKLERGKGYINVNWHCNMPKIIDTVTDMYHIENLETEIEMEYGDHYKFKLN